MKGELIFSFGKVVGQGQTEVNKFIFHILVLCFNGTLASTGKLTDVNMSLGWNAPVDGLSPANEEWTDCTT